MRNKRRLRQPGQRDLLGFFNTSTVKEKEEQDSVRGEHLEKTGKKVEEEKESSKPGDRVEEIDISSIVKSVKQEAVQEAVSTSSESSETRILDKLGAYRSTLDNKLRVVVDAEDVPPSYLLKISYDGAQGKAVAYLYNDNENCMYIVYDKTGHKPYFLVDLEPDKVREIHKIVGSESFDHLETVDKFDLLHLKWKKMTKIVVKDPLAVRRMRSLVPRAWEADIKYHDNYVYDNQLIPGLKYRVVKGVLEPAYAKPGDEVLENLKKVLKDEREETLRLAAEWLPLFENPPPRVPRIAVDIEVYTPTRGRMPDPGRASYPIISIAFASSDGLRKILVLKRPGVSYEEIEDNSFVELFDDEVSLVERAFEIMASYPLILTFNGDNFDLPYLYHRSLKLGIPREKIPLRVGQDYISLKYGLHVDLYQFFKNKAIQNYAFGSRYKEYTLEAVSQALLGKGKVVLEQHIADISPAKLIEYNLQDAELTLELTMFDDELVWKLIVLLMRISRMSLEDVTRKTVSTWIKSLFYWEHRRRGYLIPVSDDLRTLKGSTKSEAVIKGKKYAGAIVLEPPQGVFFDVVVLDFASLYPSIIKNWNLSYETVNPATCPGDRYLEIPEVGHKVCMSIPGITAQLTGLLRDIRVGIYKKKASSPDLSKEERSWYKVVQASLKVFINASYGVFGSEAFSLYAPPVAESVTAIGRHVIRRAIELAEKSGLIVLYGDTDSLFLWSPPRDKLDEFIEKIRKEFNLDIEKDKEYKLVAFSGLKKNYLGVYKEGGIEVKGMTGKKRNTPELFKKAFSETISLVAEAERAEDIPKIKDAVREKIHEIYSKMRSKDLSLDEIAFRVMLSKPLSEYVKNTPQHVKAALQLKMAGIDVQPGDVIIYVKTRGKTGVKPIQLAKLKEIDTEKYLEHVKTTFEQLLRALGVDWDEIAGLAKLEAYFGL